MTQEEHPCNQIAFAFAAGQLAQLDALHPAILKNREEIMQKQLKTYNAIHGTAITYADFQEVWINIIAGNV